MLFPQVHSIRSDCLAYICTLKQVLHIVVPAASSNLMWLAQNLLEQQLEVRKGELDKVDALEGKLDSELAAIEASAASLKEDLRKFEDLDALARDDEAEQAKLEEQQAALKERAGMVEAIDAAKGGAQSTSVRACQCLHDWQALLHTSMPASCVLARPRCLLSRLH